MLPGPLGFIKLQPLFESLRPAFCSDAVRQLVPVFNWTVPYVTGYHVREGESAYEG